MKKQVVLKIIFVAIIIGVTATIFSINLQQETIQIEKKTIPSNLKLLMRKLLI